MFCPPPAAMVPPLQGFFIGLLRINGDIFEAGFMLRIKILR